MYPIHVTIESGKSSAILYSALKRQFEYYQHLNKYLLEEGVIEGEQTFDLDCVASTFTDRGAPIMGLGSRIAEDTHRHLLRMYELQHRTHIVDTSIAKVLSPGLARPMRGPTYQVILVAYQFVCNNDPFSRWMHLKYGVRAIKWVTRVTYGRFSSFGAAAWVLLSRVCAGQPPLWEVLCKFLATFPSVAQDTDRYTRLRGWLDDGDIRERANAMVAIYLKVNLPFTRHAARVITYNDAQKLVNTTVAALSDWDVQKRNRFFSSDPLDVYGTQE